MSYVSEDFKNAVKEVLTEAKASNFGKGWKKSHADAEGTFYTHKDGHEIHVGKVIKKFTQYQNSAGSHESYQRLKYKKAGSHEWETWGDVHYGVGERDVKNALNLNEERSPEQERAEEKATDYIKRSDKEKALERERKLMKQKNVKEDTELDEQKDDHWVQETGHNEYRVLVNGVTVKEFSGKDAKQQAHAYKHPKPELMPLKKVKEETELDESDMHNATGFEQPVKLTRGRPRNGV